MQITEELLETEDKKKRLLWSVGSVCLIYSRSNKKWYDGVIEKIVNPDNKNKMKEWLVVRYKNNKKTKKIQRNCDGIKPISNDHVLSLKKGSNCLIYSNVINSWCKATVLSVFNDDEGEWLNVKYIEHDTYKVCDIQRYSKELKSYALDVDDENDDNKQEDLPYANKLQQLLDLGWDKDAATNLLCQYDGNIDTDVLTEIHHLYHNENNDDSELSLLLQNDTNSELVPFPHFDSSRIDVRTIKEGDCTNYADPFASVEMMYTGYIYNNDKKWWTLFTSESISSTVFETTLGNNENIIGLEQAMLSMSKGEIAKVYIPSRLGYGEHGADPLIPPNADMLFKITIIDINNDIDHNVTINTLSNYDDHEQFNKKMMRKFSGEWNQKSFDNVYNTLNKIDYIKKYPLEILVCISNFAMDHLFPHKDKTKIDVRTIKKGDDMTYPDPFSKIKVKYTGYNYDNHDKVWKQFTSTNISSTPFETLLGNHENIIGLEQALLSMSLNEVTRIWVPSRLAYGHYGAQPLIEPDQDLVFELTLMQINNDITDIESENDIDDDIDSFGVLVDDDGML